jgi:hypothetical protein
MVMRDPEPEKQLLIYIGAVGMFILVFSLCVFSQ